jgi:hypothetical protein
MKFLGKFGAGRVLLKPASDGPGDRTGTRSAVLEVAESAHSDQMYRTNNPHMCKIDHQCLGQLKSYNTIMARRGSRLRARLIRENEMAGKCLKARKKELYRRDSIFARVLKGWIDQIEHPVGIDR